MPHELHTVILSAKVIQDALREEQEAERYCGLNLSGSAKRLFGQNARREYPWALRVGDKEEYVACAVGICGTTVNKFNPPAYLHFYFPARLA